MEAALLTLDGLAFLVLVYMGLRDERGGAGAIRKSFFRMRGDDELRPREAAELARRDRLARSRA